MPLSPARRRNTDILLRRLTIIPPPLPLPSQAGGLRRVAEALPARDAMTSPASLVRPCLERIAQNATARKQAGLRQDVLALLEELDSALPLQPAQPPEQQRAASPTPEAPPARPPRGAAPGVHAGLAEDPESGAFRLTLCLEDDDDGGGEEGGEDGEVPLAEEAGRQMTPRQRGGEHHPGALTDEAALRESG